jgi:hypothetical protein
VVNLATRQGINRVSILIDASAKGTVEVLSLPSTSKSASLEGSETFATISLNGTESRATAEFAAVQCAAVAIRWIPQQEGQPLTVRELNLFSDVTVSTHECAAPLATVAQGNVEDSTGNVRGAESSVDPAVREEADSKRMNEPDGKTLRSFKSGREMKEIVDPVTAGPEGVFNPGQLGFPPNLSTRTLNGRRTSVPPLPPGGKKPLTP